MPKTRLEETQADMLSSSLAIVACTLEDKIQNFLLCVCVLGTEEAHNVTCCQWTLHLLLGSAVASKWRACSMTAVREPLNQLIHQKQTIKGRVPSFRFLQYATQQECFLTDGHSSPSV